MNTPLSKILNDFSEGKFVLVLDEHREKEGDFFCLAETVTKEQVNFLFQYAHGQICVACAPEILNRLALPPMVKNPSDEFGTNFTISVDAAKNITTGVSASDRVQTMRILGNPNSAPIDLLRPGHTFPLRAKKPHERWGHTEASVELAKTVKKFPAIVICEILNEYGEKASKEELLALANKFQIATTTLEKLQSLIV
jgi:3,4-dihydroxy 2-butanone 4-phosphate synthase/GTP cyclohydrolase II